MTTYNFYSVYNYRTWYEYNIIYYLFEKKHTHKKFTLIYILINLSTQYYTTFVYEPFFTLTPLRYFFSFSDSYIYYTHTSFILNFYKKKYILLYTLFATAAATTTTIHIVATTILTLNSYLFT